MSDHSDAQASTSGEKKEDIVGDGPDNDFLTPGIEKMSLEGKDTEGKDTEGKDTEGKDTEGKEAEDNEAERRETERTELERSDTRPMDFIIPIITRLIENEERRNEMHLHDNITIVVGENGYRCNMLILQLSSGLFAEMERTDCIELPANKLPGNSFELAYNMVLDPSATVDRENVFELIVASEYLEISKVHEKCFGYLDEYVFEDRAFFLSQQAHQYGLEDIVIKLLQRVSKSFLPLVATEDYLILCCDDVCTLLSSDMLGVNTEIEVFLAAVRWLSYRWRGRKSFAERVMKCVRFHQMPADYIRHLLYCPSVRPIRRLTEIPEVRNVMMQGLHYVSDKKFFAACPEQLKEILAQTGLSEPIERKWLFDKYCNYHRHSVWTDVQHVLYSAFVKYLIYLKDEGIDHWKTLELFAEATAFSSMIRDGVSYVCHRTVQTQTEDRYLRKWTRKFESETESETDDDSSEPNPFIAGYSKSLGIDRVTGIFTDSTLNNENLLEF